MRRKKRCRDCGVEKKLSDFYENIQEGRPNQASHRPECKACNKARRQAKMKPKRKPTYMQEFR